MIPEDTRHRIEKARADGRLTSEAHGHLMRWVTGEEYAPFGGEIVRLVEASRWDEIADAFGEILPFGTGGRRGGMGVGPNRINDRTIGESAQGLAAHVLASRDGRRDGRAPAVVIAYDTRHNSRRFASKTASVLAGNGLKAMVFEGPRSTPELSFAVRHLGADAGVVISASHNPPTDNGFKAYWSDGGQVVPPHDRAIIDEVVRARELREMPEAEARQRGLIEPVGAEVDRAYVGYNAGLCLDGQREIGLAFTPLHGTGSTSVWPALESAGFAPIHRVAEQWDEDGDFPNVPKQSPNPEVPAALEAAQAVAERKGVGLVLASDPDADRLGAAVRTGGGWRFLHGNEIGVLLLEHVLGRLSQRGELPAGSVVYKTLVTSDLIDRICAAHGVSLHGDLLVGFKHVAEEIERLSDPSLFLFGTEESHGYLRGAAVRDKDAAQAAVLLAERAARARAEGGSLLDDLDAIHRRYGYCRELTRGVTFDAGGSKARWVEMMRALMVSLRSDLPTRLNGERITAVVDRDAGTVRDPDSGRVTGEIDGARGNVLVFRLEGAEGDRVTIRPSGTEPKIKVYVQVHGGAGENLDATRRSLDARAEGLMRSMEELARRRMQDG